MLKRVQKIVAEDLYSNIAFDSDCNCKDSFLVYFIISQCNELSMKNGTLQLISIAKSMQILDSFFIYISS